MNQSSKIEVIEGTFELVYHVMTPLYIKIVILYYYIVAYIK